MTSSTRRKLPRLDRAGSHTRRTRRISSSMPPISPELCLACSGNVFSSSQNPKLPTSAKPVPQEPSKLQPETHQQQTNTGGEAEKRGHKAETSVFRTQCCGRPICFACIASNPRLARYVPCLACLGGVRAVAGEGESGRSINGCEQRWEKESGVGMNLNGALRDLDVFVLGDDDDDDDDGDSDLNLGQGVQKRKNVLGGGGAASDSSSESPPPAYSEMASGPELVSSHYSLSITSNTGTRRPPAPGLKPANRKDSGRSGDSAVDEEEEETKDLKKGEGDVERPNMHTPAPSLTTTPVPAPLPRKHYLQKDDTMRGLALRYNIDGRMLCRLNNLPPSTLATTPHLLHTRTVLVLPPSAKHLSPGPPGVNEDKDKGRHKERDGHEDDTELESERDRERERQIEMEKTAKRIQVITKEANWDVAKAYAVLAAEEEDVGSSSADFVGVCDNSISSYFNRNRMSRYAGVGKEIHELLEGKEKREEWSWGCGDYGGKEKEKSGGPPKNLSTNMSTKEKLNKKMNTLQERALDAYLEDDAWEEDERKAGRGPGSISASASAFGSGSGSGSGSSDGVGVDVGLRTSDRTSDRTRNSRLCDRR